MRGRRPLGRRRRRSHRQHRVGADPQHEEHEEQLQLGESLERKLEVEVLASRIFYSYLPVVLSVADRPGGVRHDVLGGGVPGGLPEELQHVLLPAPRPLPQRPLPAAQHGHDRVGP